MQTTSLRYGLISGIAICVLTSLPTLWLDAKHPDYTGMEIFGYSSMLASLGIIFFALLHLRRQQGGSLSFAQGLKLGLGVTGIAALVFGLFSIVLYKWLMPDVLTSMMDSYTAHAPAGSKPMSAAELELWLNPYFEGFIMAATIVLLGLGVSLVAALILQRKAKAPAVGSISTVV